MMDAISWIALAVCSKRICYLFWNENRSSHQHKAVVVSFTPFISFHNHRHRYMINKCQNPCPAILSSLNLVSP
ncbi:hypothetical protein NC651_013487 [Populus alba x Populus x berolinensis]|nr:hypothetical protein NC651_013487 [Populus alba x Populus x berolinensis]